LILNIVNFRKRDNDITGCLRAHNKTEIQYLIVIIPLAIRLRLSRDRREGGKKKRKKEKKKKGGRKKEKKKICVLISAFNALTFNGFIYLINYRFS